MLRAIEQPAMIGELAAGLLLGPSMSAPFTGRPFLGHGVEHLLEEAPPTVVVVTVPPGWRPPPARRA